MNKHPGIDINKYECSSKRREVSLFLCELLSNMNFMARVKFVFTGNYYDPLQKTYDALKIKRKKK